MSKTKRELAGGKLLWDEPAEQVVRLTISNPAKRNALDHPILDAITDALTDGFEVSLYLSTAVFAVALALTFAI